MSIDLENLMRSHEWYAGGRWVKLKDCETDYLEDVLLQEELPSATRLVILSLLKERWGIDNRHLKHATTPWDGKPCI